MNIDNPYLIQWIGNQVRAAHFDVEKEHSHVWHFSSLNFCYKTFLFASKQDKKYQSICNTLNKIIEDIEVKEYKTEL